MNNIFDSHCHYSDSAFDNDRYELIERLHRDGVSGFMLASSNKCECEDNLELAGRYDYVYTAVGIHPEAADETGPDICGMLEKWAEDPKVKAIGEIGLDYHYEGYSRERQISLFKSQLELAQRLGLPVIIHSRDASKDTMDILREYMPKGVVHCFSGSAETAGEVISIGMYVGFTGVLTFKNAKKALRALECVPAERLLLETDCPYMAPVPFRGKRCDSSMIEYTAEKAAQIKNMDVQELIDITNCNAKRLFSIG